MYLEFDIVRIMFVNKDGTKEYNRISVRKFIYRSDKHFGY